MLFRSDLRNAGDSKTSRRTVPSVRLFIVGFFDEVVVDLPDCHPGQQSLAESTQSTSSPTQRRQSREDPRRRRRSRSFCKISRYVPPGSSGEITLAGDDRRFELVDKSMFGS